MNPMRASLGILAFPALLLLAAHADAEEPAPQPDPAELRAQVLRLVGGLKDPDITKVQAAVDGLVAIRSPFAGPYLWQLYEVGEGHRRRLALSAIGILKPEGCEDRIFQASLTDWLVSIRKVAADNLVRVIGSDAAAALYLKALNEPNKLNPIGRLHAVQNLGRVGGKGVREALAKLLQDKDSDVAGAAAESLGILRDLANAHLLIANLNHPDPEVRPTVSDALETLTGQKNGFDRVKWESWIADYKAGKFNDHKDEGDVVISFTDEAYKAQQAKENNPFVRPLKECGIDVAVVFDTTGSMLHIWPELSNAIDAILREIEKNTPSVRLGAVRYRASDPHGTMTYLIQPKALTRKIQDARDFILDASFGGGSGGLHLGIRHAITSFAWRANARRMVLIVGDTTPSEDGLEKAVAMVKAGWEQDGILFNTLYVSTLHGAEQKPTYGQIAQAGGGRFYQYDKAWKHLVDQSVEKVDPKKTEQPSETWQKWLTPLERKK